jgi:hypothetical protein
MLQAMGAAGVVGGLAVIGSMMGGALQAANAVSEINPRERVSAE